MASRSFSNSNPISAIICLEKEVYQVGESIPVEFRITNQTLSSIVISSRIFQPNYLHITIRDENGNPVKFLGEVYKLPLVRPCDFILLNKGYFYGKRFDISKGEEAFELDKPGRYTITGYYENKDKDELMDRIATGDLKDNIRYPMEKIWSGRVDLHPKTFEILNK